MEIDYASNSPEPPIDMSLHHPRNSRGSSRRVTLGGIGSPQQVADNPSLRSHSATIAPKPRVLRNTASLAERRDAIHKLEVATPLPLIDLYRTPLAWLVKNPSRLPIVTSFFKAHFGHFALMYRLGLLCEVAVFIVPHVWIANWLSLGAMMLCAPLLVSSFLFMSVDLLVMLTRYFEFWFFSIVNVIYIVSLAWMLGDWRVLCLVTQWLDFQTFICMDANFRTIRLTLKHTLFNMVILGFITVSVRLQLVPVNIKHAIKSQTMDFGVDDTYFDSWWILLLLLLRRSFTKRKVLNSESHGKRIIRCVLFRVSLVLRPVSLMRLTNRSHTLRNNFALFGKTKATRMMVVEIKRISRRRSKTPAAIPNLKDQQDQQAKADSQLRPHQLPRPSFDGNRISINPPGPQQRSHPSQQRSHPSQQRSHPSQERSNPSQSRPSIEGNRVSINPRRVAHERPSCFQQTMLVSLRVNTIDLRRVLYSCGPFTVVRLTTERLPMHWLALVYFIGGCGLVNMIFVLVAMFFLDKSSWWLVVPSLVAFTCTSTWCLVFLLHMNSQLLRSLTRLFSFWFLSFQSFAATITLSLMLEWDISCLSVASWWLWMQFSLCFDTLAPPYRHRFGLRKTHLACVPLLTLVLCAYLITMIVYDSSQPERNSQGLRLEAQRMIIVAFGPKPNQSMEFNTQSFLLRRLVMLFAWTFRLVYGCLFADENELLLINGKIDYFTPLEMFPSNEVANRRSFRSMISVRTAA